MGSTNADDWSPPSAFSEQAMPQDIKAEMAVLGAVLLDRNALITARLELSGPDDFFAAKHQTLFRAMCHLYDKGQPIDLITLPDVLNKPLRAGYPETHLDYVGGFGYLMELTHATVSTASVPAYAKIVARKARLRRLIMAGYKTVDLAREADADGEDPDEAAAKAAADAEAALRQVTAPAQTEGLHSIGGIVDRARARLENQGKPNPNRIEFGFREWDQFAWMRREVLSIHAPSGGTKSTVLRQFSINLAKRKGVSAFFALETFEEQMDDCLIAQEGRLSLHRIRNMDRNPLSKQEQERFLAAAERVESYKPYMHFNHDPMQRFSDIRTKVLQLAMKTGDVTLIGIDYSDLVQKTGGKGDRHEQQLIQMHYEGKALAKEVNALVVFIDQAPIEMLKRGDPTPTIFDFEYAKGIPKACDHCVGLIVPSNCKSTIVGKTRITPSIPVPGNEGEPMLYNDKRWENTILAAYTKGRFERPGYLLPLYHDGPSGYVGNLARRPWDAKDGEVGQEGTAAPIVERPAPEQQRLWNLPPQDEF